MNAREEWSGILACPGHDFQGHETTAIGAETVELRAALDAAQDEIERCIADRARVLAYADSIDHPEGRENEEREVVCVECRKAFGRAYWPCIHRQHAEGIRDVALDRHRPGDPRRKIEKRLRADNARLFTTADKTPIWVGIALDEMITEALGSDA